MRGRRLLHVLMSVAAGASAATSGAQAAGTASGWQRWFDPDTAPFIPVPEIDTDPDSGTTLGLIPTWLETDAQGQITRIWAPDVLHNPYFGLGARVRVFSYPSADKQWYVVAGGKQRVEREFDAKYQVGRLRQSAWSVTAEAAYDRSGTPRFYGFGNASPAIQETDYTDEQIWVQTTVGRNLSRDWQLGFTERLRRVDVTPGSLAGIATIGSRFGRLLGTGVNYQSINRVALTWDTRDDPTVPSRGVLTVLYGGLGLKHGISDDSQYSEAGIDTRGYLPLLAGTLLAAHVSLRYQPTAHDLPFWAYSSIGGADSQLGESQPLRGFGTSRFYDRNAFSASLELRRRILQRDTLGTHIEVELTPFVDFGRVFSRTRTSPFTHMHTVEGLGFRGIARPNVVGFVDIGYGSEGIAVFTGINFPI